MALTCSVITLLSTYCAAAFQFCYTLGASSPVPVAAVTQGETQVSDVEIRKKREMVGDTVRINAPAFLSFSFPFYFIHLISPSETVRLNEGLDRLLEAVDLEEGRKSQRERREKII